MGTRKSLGSLTMGDGAAAQQPGKLFFLVHSRNREPTRKRQTPQSQEHSKVTPTPKNKLPPESVMLSGIRQEGTTLAKQNCFSQVGAVPVHQASGDAQPQRHWWGFLPGFAMLSAGKKGTPRTDPRHLVERLEQTKQSWR